MKKFFKWLFISVALLVALAGIRWAVASDEERSMINDMKAYVAYMYEGVRHSLDSTYTMDYSRVHHYIDRAIELSPGRENAYYSKALYYNMEDGDNSRAVGVYKAMCDKGVDVPYSTYMAADAYDGLGRYEEAMLYYKMAGKSYGEYLDTAGVDTSFAYSQARSIKKHIDERLLYIDSMSVDVER